MCEVCGRVTGNPMHWFVIQCGDSEHKQLVDMWYVIRGEGTLVTGGSLSEPTETEPDEFREPGITGGEERHIATGDFVRIPALVPHWIRKVNGDDFLYLVVKAPQ